MALRKVKKMSHANLRELAGLCGAMALLVVGALFVNGGGVEQAYRVAMGQISPGSQTASIWPCGWFGDCPNSFVYTQSFSPNTPYQILGQSYSANWTSSAPGQSVTFYWTIFGDRYANFCAMGSCNITADAPTQPCPGGIRGHGGGGGCPSNISGTGGSFTVAPTRTTTYYLCSDVLIRQGVGCAASTITVPAATPTTLTSLTATPSTVVAGSPTTLSWTGAKGTSFSACQLTGGQWGSGTWFSQLPGSTPTSPLSTNTTYSMNCYDSTGASTGWKSATVTVTPATDICTDIPGTQATLPAGCTGPTPSPVGSCVPAGYTYDATSNSCVAASCANGLGSQYAPTCTCPTGQGQSGSLCVPNPTSCSNGLDPSYLPSCTCPSSQVQSGTSCVSPGTIDNLSVSPSARVRKGDTATITWSTSNMASCSLTGPSNGSVVTLSTSPSSSISPVIQNQSIFTLTCIDKVGTARSQSVTINLIPQTIEQ